MIILLQNLILIFISLVKIHPSLSTAIGKQHSKSSSGSVELLTWGQDYKQKDIYLSSYAPTYSVVVLIVNDLPWTEQQLGHLSGEFTLHSPGSSFGGKWGIMAVIQALYLRSSTSSSSNYDCIDYIQFYDPISALGSSKICGKLSKNNASMNSMVGGSRVFSSGSGMMQVSYSSAPGDPSYPTHDVSFHMVEIVFTAIKECDPEDVSSEWSHCGVNHCISSRTRCDERINCGDLNQFGMDEINCTSVSSSDDHHFHHRQTEASFSLSDKTGRVLLVSCLAITITIIASIFYHYYTKTYQRIRNISCK